MFRVMFVLLLSLVAIEASATTSRFAPNAPKDVPSALDAKKLSELTAAQKPLIAEARRTYPAVRARYLSGLPKDHIFSVTTILHDSEGKIEQVFVLVTKIADGQIYGRIVSQIILVKGFSNGQDYQLPESELVDWTISNPDGSEEGNLLGKNLDDYNARNGT